MMRWSSACIFLAIPGTFFGQVVSELGQVAPNLGQVASARGPRTPVLGYLTSDSPLTVRPIVGAPGAIVVGGAIPLPQDVTRFVLAPGRTFGIVERAGGEGLGILQLGVVDAGEVHALPNTLAHTDRIGFSPSGTTAVLYSAAQRRAQVVTGLPLSGQIAQDIDLIILNGIPVTSVAVSDDADAVLVGASDGTNGAVWSFPAGQPAQQLAHLGIPSAMRFFPGKQDAAVADSGWQQLSVLAGVNGQFSLRLVASAVQGITAPTDLEISDDQQRVWMADSSGSLLSVELSSGAATTSNAAFSPAKLTKLSGRSLYLVTSQDSTSSGVWAPAAEHSELWRLAGAAPGAGR